MERLRFCLFGRPVRHSISPAMHAAAIRAMGLSHSYNALDVPTEDSLRRLMSDVRRGAFHGVNVTVPYKRAVMDMVDEVAESAAEVGAANCLVRARDGRVIAHNTDARGLAADLSDAFGGRSPLRAVILGAGGAGLAAIVACRALGFKVVVITSRSWTGSEAAFEAPSAAQARALGALTRPWPSQNPARAASGKASQALRLQWSDLATSADLVVQATTAGMQGGPNGDEVTSLVPWTNLSPDTVAYDVVYNPAETPFLRAARARRLSARSGIGMLVQQAVLSFELWTGLTPPAAVMRRAAEAALAAAI